MAELTDKCEHCGSLNLRGALYCETCGKGIPANMAARYERVTKKSRIFLILSIVSAILAAVMIINQDEISYSMYFLPEEAVALLLFLLCGIAMYALFMCIKNFSERSRYRTETAPSAGNPEGGNPESAPRPAVRMDNAELVKIIGDHKKRGKSFCLASLPFMLVGVVMLIMTGGEFSILAIIAIVLLVAFFALLWVGIGSFGKATKMFKEVVVSDALASIIGECVYRPEQSISRDRIEAAGLFSEWNKFHGEDYLSGTYKGHHIEFSDIHLEHEYTDNKDQTITDTIFRGHWITCRLAKSLPAIIRLGEGEGKSNAETENVAFNQKYRIYTDDPHYMFYVLTPHFMEYIVAADEKASARTYFYFAGNMVHIAVYNDRNIFEISSADSNDPDKARERVKNEMKYITGILDELLRNEYLFGDVPLS